MRNPDKEAPMYNFAHYINMNFEKKNWQPLVFTEHHYENDIKLIAKSLNVLFKRYINVLFNTYLYRPPSTMMYFVESFDKPFFVICRHCAQ